MRHLQILKQYTSRYITRPSTLILLASMDNTAKQSEAEQHEYIGQNVEDIPKPAAILEASKIQRHCSSMLEVAQRLDVGFRAHIKTHKV
jgi:hypothetical protein